MGIFIGKSHIKQVFLTGVCKLLTDEGKQWLNRGPIKRKQNLRKFFEDLNQHRQLETYSVRLLPPIIAGLQSALHLRSEEKILKKIDLNDEI